MVKIDNWKDPKLIEAIQVWTGYGDANSPRRDNSLVKKRFGDEADEWIFIIESLVDEFYQTSASLEARDLSEMWRISIADFEAKYPESRGEISNALAWCYTFDNR